MRWRSFTWFLLSVLCFVGAIYFWRLGDEWAAKKSTPPSAQSTNRDGPGQASPDRPHTQAAIKLLSDQQTIRPDKKNRFRYRLTNTQRKIGELSHVDHAILLENALLDTDQNPDLIIPSHLRTKGAPGTYIVQSRSALDDSFRARLKNAGGEIISYIPNNAYLVRISEQGADALRADAQAVIAYEPYFKLKSSLLRLAVNQEQLPDDIALHVLLL